MIGSGRLEDGVPSENGAARTAAIEGLTGAFEQRGRHVRAPDNVVYTAKEEPQPHVVEALGLRITNCAPCNPSL